ncbi:hypothetical protein EYF80_005885 [Liparis tanakae]|uniref:Uncharacterized protein n=1 Tax=Liparis tanakae TaxID=230148 RepID=A0A4Z2J2E5_9TELE|nr:hypothetical protein EYF80_005885 [Liparis tanakae]
MANSNITAPTPTSTIATIEGFVASLSSSSLPSSPSPSVELLDVGGPSPEFSLSIGITVHTIMTIPRAMSPTPRAHRAYRSTRWRTRPPPHRCDTYKLNRSGSREFVKINVRPIYELLNLIGRKRGECDLEEALPFAAQWPRTPLFT